MLARLSMREKRLAAVTAAVVVAAVAYRFVILPQVTRMWDLADKAATSEINLSEMEQALARASRVEGEYAGYAAEIAQKGTDLEESVAFLHTVSDLTTADGMKPTSQESLPIEVGSYYKLFSVRMGVATRPVWLARFVAALEKSEQVIRIEDIRIVALDDSENLSVNMKLTRVVAREGEAK